MANQAAQIKVIAPDTVIRLSVWTGAEATTNGIIVVKANWLTARRLSHWTFLRLSVSSLPNQLHISPNRIKPTDPVPHGITANASLSEKHFPVFRKLDIDFYPFFCTWYDQVGWERKWELHSLIISQLAESTDRQRQELLHLLHPMQG